MFFLRAKKLFCAGRKGKNLSFLVCTVCRHLATKHFIMKLLFFSCEMIKIWKGSTAKNTSAKILLSTEPALKMKREKSRSRFSKVQMNAMERYWVMCKLGSCSQSTGGVSSNHCWLVEGSRQKNYRPLLERPCCESLESRINHFVKRGRLEREEGENGDETIHRGKKSKHSYNASSPSASSEIPKQTVEQKLED